MLWQWINITVVLSFKLSGKVTLQIQQTLECKRDSVCVEMCKGNHNLCKIRSQL